MPPLMFVALATTVTSPALAQDAVEPPIVYRDLLQWVINKVPVKTVLDALKERGCLKLLTYDEEQRLSSLGATNMLIGVARSECSRPRIGVGFGDEQFARIDPGSFPLGSTAGDVDERPIRNVRISRSFWLQRTEVTQGQWQEVMGLNPSEFSECGELCPVEQVSWDEVQRFLQRLNSRDPERQYRLPSEAEWEYAAWAGGTGGPTDAGRLSVVAWFYDNAGGRTHPVALKRANAWGVYDMLGNVAEWVLDWYSAKAYALLTPLDPQGPENGRERVIRGGSWFSLPGTKLRISHRMSIAPHLAAHTTGFRLVRIP